MVLAKLNSHTKYFYLSMILSLFFIYFLDAAFDYVNRNL